jgi:hypothetical protein
MNLEKLPTGLPLHVTDGSNAADFNPRFGKKLHSPTFGRLRCSLATIPSFGQALRPPSRVPIMRTTSNRTALLSPRNGTAERVPFAFVSFSLFVQIAFSYARHK